MNIVSNELNDLYDYGYKIYQNKEYFKFSLDSILLAEYINISKKDKNILDLCTGNAPIPLILNKKYGKDINIVGVELQDIIYDLALKSLEFNNIDNIKLINDNLNNISKYYKLHCFDIVCVNPPYYEVSDKKIISDNDIKAIARHELTTNLEDIIKVSANMLKNQGYFYMVHKAYRLADTINLLNKYNLGVKEIVPIYSKEKDKAVCFLIKALYNGKNYVNILEPVFIDKLNTYQGLFEVK